jgi:ArsR family transcriptional regulator, arsenate/arsenite/antimonite-responsive transcriptional repressor / arsenate reductase (thioredoxin)
VGGSELADLERRARMHAALGEPVRLAIVDRLMLGDAAPGELSAAFDLPTNLLAHHLRVLEEARLIRRVSSEGDRRRSYVQLAHDDPAVTALAHPGRLSEGVERVVFVCTHNSARSQLAAAAWTQLSSLPAASAGTHPARRVHPRAIRTGRGHGLHLEKAGTAHLTDVLLPEDLVVAVCDKAHEELSAVLPEPRPARLHWAVADPAPIDTDQAFETAYQQISHRIDRLAQALPDDHPNPPARTRQGAPR